MWCVDFQVDPVRKQPSTHRRTMRERGKIKGEFMKKKKNSKSWIRQTNNKKGRPNKNWINKMLSFFFGECDRVSVCVWLTSFLFCQARSMACPWGGHTRRIHIGCAVMFDSYMGPFARRTWNEQHSSQQRSPAQSLLLFIFVSPFCRHSGWWLSYFSLSAPLSLPDHDDDRSGSNSKCHVGLFLFLAGRSVVKREHKIK